MGIYFHSIEAAYNFLRSLGFKAKRSLSDHLNITPCLTQVIALQLIPSPIPVTATELEWVLSSIFNF